MEMDSDGTWRPTEERTSNMERQQKREDFQADTERIRAMAYRDQVGVTAQKALAAGDMETYKAKAQQLASTPNSMQKTYDRMMKGDVNSNDWGELSKLARGGPESDPSLMSDISSQQFTPRVAQFVRAQVGKDALESIVLSKGSTNFLEIDWTNPKMREFQDQVSQINVFMRSNPAVGQLASIQSSDDKMRFLNTLAASQVLMGMSSAPSPSGGMTPATAGPQQGGGGAPMAGDASRGTSDPYATDQGTQAAIEARQRGEDVPPTDTPAFRQKFQGEDPLRNMCGFGPK
jgi:hypothetical protein